MYTEQQFSIEDRLRGTLHIGVGQLLWNEAIQSVCLHLVKQ